MCRTKCDLKYVPIKLAFELIGANAYALLRYCEGVFPVIFLKAALKVDLDLKPAN